MDTQEISLWEKYKDQLQPIMDLFKSQEATSFFDPNDNKDFTFEIKGGDQTGGISFEFRSSTESEYNEIVPEIKDYMANLDTLSVLTFNGKTAEETAMFQSCYLSLKPFLDEGFKSETFLRIEGTKICIDFPHPQSGILSNYLDTGFNSGAHQKFFISLKSLLKATDFFNLNFEEFAKKLLSLDIFVNQKFLSISHLLPKFIDLIEQLIMPEYQSVIDFIVIGMRFFNLFLSAEFKFEYNPKELVNLALSSPLIDEVGGKEMLESGFESMKMSVDLLKAKINDEQLISMLGILDLEAITFITVFPKYKIGSTYALKIPGLNQVIKEKILNKETNQLPMN